MKNYEPYISPTAELYHWGIPLMKWGQQRYQNKDGTWTEEGLRRRREREGKGDGKKHTTVTVTVKPNNGGKNYQEPVKKSNKPYKPPATTKLRTREEQELIVNELLYNMSDAEIQAAIDRLNLEKKYKDLLLPEVKKGKEATKNILDILGDASGPITNIAKAGGEVVKLAYFIKHPEAAALGKKGK